MKKVILMFAASTMLFAQCTIAQDATATIIADAPADQSAMKYAELRAAAYAEAFGLGEKETAKMAEIFLEGEKQLVGVRTGEMSKDIEAKVDGTMRPYDEQAERMLNEEQKAKLDRMKKDGTWDPGAASCAPAKGKSCAGHGEVKAGGCCAGKAGAHGAKPAGTSTAVQ